MRGKVVQVGVLSEGDNHSLHAPLYRLVVARTVKTTEHAHQGGAPIRPVIPRLVSSQTNRHKTIMTSFTMYKTGPPIVALFDT